MAIRTLIYQANLARLRSLIGSKSLVALNVASKWSDRHFDDLDTPARERFSQLLYSLVWSGVSYNTLPVPEHPLLNLAIIALLQGVESPELVLGDWHAGAFDQLGRCLNQHRPDGNAVQLWGWISDGRRLDNQVPAGGLPYYGFLTNDEVGDLLRALGSVDHSVCGCLKGDLRLFLHELGEAFRQVFESGQDMFSITC